MKVDHLLHVTIVAKNSSTSEVLMKPATKMNIFRSTHPILIWMACNGVDHLQPENVSCIPGWDCKLVDNTGEQTILSVQWQIQQLPMEMFFDKVAQALSHRQIFIGYFQLEDGTIEVPLWFPAFSEGGSIIL